MSVMKIGLVALALVVAYGAGRRHGSNPADEHGTHGSAVAADTRELAVLRAKNAELEMRLATLESSRVERAPSVTDSAEKLGAKNDKWRLLAAMGRNRSSSPELAFVDSTGRLDPGAPALFELTAQEQGAIELSMVNAASAIEALERRNASVTRTGDREVMIEVKPFPEAGGIIYDNLMESVAKTLGAERTAAFMALCAPQVERAFGDFGAATRTVKITVDLTADRSKYRAEDLRVAPNGRWSRSSNFRDRGELVSRIGSVTKLLPDGY